MDPHAGQWLGLALRWLHVVAGISWIGTSFYFNWLNGQIRPPPPPPQPAPPQPPEPGVAGEVWSVHGGGFYRAVKYGVAPARLPATLHWFQWEAYVTWLSGVALLVLIYYLDAAAYLLDPQSADVTPRAAVGICLATLLAGWLVYDLLCRSPLGTRGGALAAVGVTLTAALAWGLTAVVSPRAAYIHVGALLGTVMAGNVFRMIIPAQREMVAAMAAGRSPDARRGGQAALRSLHNNYLTLPVLFIMVSMHYPATYGHRWSWAVLVGMSLVGAGVRHWFNLRHQGRRNRWILPAAAAAMVALAVATAPRRPAAQTGGGATVPFDEVRVIVARRCAGCHSSTPTHPAFTTAPAGAVLDTPEQIRALALRIEAVTVVARTMPLGNATGMTPEERERLGRWVREGARIR
ncbi:MAG: urate hydroxylase PuuD [Gemmatimonadales bacterium]